MRGAVETVFSYMKFFVALIGHTEHICFFGHSLVKRRIEYNNLRNVIGNNLLACSQGESVRMIMYRGKFGKTVNLINNLIGYYGCLIEYFGALYYSVSYRGNLVHCPDNSGVPFGKSLYNPFKGFRMRGEITILTHLSAIKGFVSNMTVHTYSFAVALCNYALVIHIDKLIFQRRAARIDN